MIVKRCSTCRRFRSYEEGDIHCLVCGNQTLDAACQCGRTFDYALAEDGGDLHCPRCGRRLRGRDDGIE